LRAALSAADSVQIRVALGRRLLEIGQPGEALPELERAIAAEPANREALEAAARAARAVGDAARAQAYELALSAPQAPSPAVPPPQVAPRPPASQRPPSPQAPPPQERAPGEVRIADPEAAPRLRLVTSDDAAEVEGKPAVTFADVGGLDDVKQRLNRSFLLPLKQPELFAKFGKSLRGGLLLYGPPGCGKTFVARALAGEIGARFISIGLSDVLDMWLGESERKLHELFETARRAAPTVLFLDEVDALGQRRTQLKHSAGRNIVNQLLSEMDGVDSANRDLFVLGATNHPWDIDPALRRPGRFDRMVFVPAPDPPARERILSLRLADRPTAPALDLKALAQRTDGFSGADLAGLVDAATEMAFERTVDSGREQPIDDALLVAALKDARPSTQPWLETARNYALYANEGGSYDDLLAYLKSRRLA
jgi:SpoVK/Ycf46/Vps4 family AAA+-type ATPase